MQFLIIGLLLSGPLTLYDLHKRFAGGVALFYAASFGSIRRSLVVAEQKGWIIGVDDDTSVRRRRPYEATPAGREAWRAWMTEPLSGSSDESKMLAKVFLLGELPASERIGCLGILRKHVTEALGDLLALAAENDAAVIPRAQAERFRYRRATLEYGIRSHRLALDWLDDVEATP